MKKILIFSLLLVYTTMACGVNVQLHYCGGKLKSISLFDNTKNGCCCGTKKKSKNCCKDKTTYLKVKDKHNSNSSLKDITFKGKALECFITYFTYKIHIESQDECITYYHAPPVLYDNPLYLKNKVLII